MSTSSVSFAARLVSSVAACMLALAAAGADIKMTSAQYLIPDVKLVRADGRTVSLPHEIDDGRPVVLNFIFTSCTAVCPLTTRTFAEFQRKLGGASANVHMMSISIDPEQDTPARLEEYAKEFHAGAGWHYYTGQLAAIVTAQRAFDVYRGDKMSHTPITLLRAAPGRSWVRIEGFVTPDELLHEYRTLLVDGS